MAKHKIIELRSTPFGDYAIYVSNSRVRTWIKDYGFEVGDIAELEYDEDSRVLKAKKNGKVIYLCD